MAKPTATVAAYGTSEMALGPLPESIGDDTLQAMLKYFPAGSLVEIESKLGLQTPDEELRSNLALVIWRGLREHTSPSETRETLHRIGGAAQALRRELDACLFRSNSEQLDALFLLNAASGDARGLRALEDLASRLVALDEVVGYISDNELTANLADRPLTAERYLLIVRLRQLEFAVTRANTKDPLGSDADNNGGPFWTMLRHCDDAIAAARRSGLN